MWATVPSFGIFKQSCCYQLIDVVVQHGAINDKLLCNKLFRLVIIIVIAK